MSILMSYAKRSFERSEIRIILNGGYVLFGLEECATLGWHTRATEMKRIVWLLCGYCMVIVWCVKVARGA
jgi:hypothetical protein